MASERPTKTRPPLVFLDAESRPYSVQMVGGEWWLCYCHPSEQWVTIRPVNDVEIAHYDSIRLTDDEAQLYEDTHQSHTFVWGPQDPDRKHDEEKQDGPEHEEV